MSWYRIDSTTARDCPGTQQSLRLVYGCVKATIPGESHSGINPNLRTPEVIDISDACSEETAEMQDKVRSYC